MKVDAVKGFHEGGAMKEPPFWSTGVRNASYWKVFLFYKLLLNFTSVKTRHEYLKPIHVNL